MMSSEQPAVKRQTRAKFHAGFPEKAICWHRLSGAAPGLTVLMALTRFWTQCTRQHKSQGSHRGKEGTCGMIEEGQGGKWVVSNLLASSYGEVG
jgi:hypothetical protein